MKNYKELETSITHLGEKGDGIALTTEGQVFVPMTLPGEKVRIRIETSAKKGRKIDLLEIIEESKHRLVPHCKYFGACGGCVIQHLSIEPYLQWKQAIIVKALKNKRIDSDLIQPTIATQANGRRRTELTATKTKTLNNKLTFGYTARSTHNVVDITECPILTSTLDSIIQPLRILVEKILQPGSSCKIMLTETEVGIDMLISSKNDPNPHHLSGLSNFAINHNLARVSWRSDNKRTEPIYQERVPTVDFDGISVVLPPGSFLQTSVQSQRIITSLVIKYTGEITLHKKVADLFSGLGTFTLPLAKRGAQVHSIDISGETLENLLAASGMAGFSGRVTTEKRNLMKHPLSPAELAFYEIVIFDPPRAGAEALAKNLAVSKVPIIIAVSCNAKTFARDAEILISGGYEMVELTPVDQFVFSNQIELLARFQHK
jgi:23S rRNA (uracil1939-C5)-methyltransferase